MTRIYIKDLTADEIIDRLCNGEKMYDVDGGIFYIKNGVLINERKDQAHLIGCFLNIKRGTLYFETYKEPSLKIEIGKYYKNRKGDKCLVYCISKVSTLAWYIIEGDANTYCIQTDGRLDSTKDTAEDLISEWEDDDEV